MEDRQEQLLITRRLLSSRENDVENFLPDSGETREFLSIRKTVDQPLLRLRQKTGGNVRHHFPNAVPQCRR